MAYHRTSIISVLVILTGFANFISGQELFNNSPVPVDTAYSDTTEVPDTTSLQDQIDSLKFDQPDEISDSTEAQEKSLFPEEKISPYYQTKLSGRSYADYLWFNTGVLPLQHGSYGQAELLTKSVMLPGFDVVYNGLPFFHQGLCIPFRRGPDLNVLMFENVGQFEVTPLYTIGLFNQGEFLSLKSMFWPSNDNPSSVTVARGPYGYERSGWRFSRRFNENTALTFTAGFKKADGLYQSGADYDDFGITGSFVIRPQPSTEVRYSFYQHKAKQGVLQFDRVITSSLRNNHDQNYHTAEFHKIFTEKLQLKTKLFRQKNYSHVFNNSVDYHQIIRDEIWGGENSIILSAGRNNFKLDFGGLRHFVKSHGWFSARSVTMSVVLSDSVAFKPGLDIFLSSRARHNNHDSYSLSGSTRIKLSVGENSNISISAGLLDNLLDIYSRYYNHPDIDFADTNIVSSYQYFASKNLKSATTRFFNAAADLHVSNSFGLGIGIAFEDVEDDMVGSLTESDNQWSASMENIDYHRLTFTGELKYSMKRFFTGTSGLTYFIYDPELVIEQVKFSPELIVNSKGEFRVGEVLKDINISAVYQLRYFTSREYSGFISIISNRSRYDAAVVLDGSIIIQFGSFQFRISEDNIFDYLWGNKYNIWGEYLMPPGNVWWQFTWNFYN